ncbi:Putative chloroperoxidase [Septoria linicola]|uniref:Chloroperoxidase n=1 Tax=Septoria linicola TaxID=215465 RepID=A0A9Q9AVP8_9PEZI|nr:putative chloroperoxidase [Septoria linicola]USW56767.1 Putative chloroperoxidase [Septoria linicola]
MGFNPHLGYFSDDFKAALDDLPEQQHELVKRQLGQILADLSGQPNAAGAPATGLGILDGFGLLSDLSDVTWPLDVWYRFPFVPPGPGDQRGPCIGLNAMANHNLFPHTGIASLFELLSAAQVLGFGLDTALSIAVPAVIFGGDPITLTMSIGGPDDRIGPVLGGLGGLLSSPQGLENTHGIAEADSSSTRDDLYDTGDCSSLNVERFIKLWSLVPPGERFDLSVYGYWAAYRFHESIHISPNFWFGPTTGLLARNAGYGIPPCCLANQTGRYPDGELTHEILESFYAITHYPAPFTHIPGWERIPANWYGLRSIGSSWPLVQVIADVLGFCASYNELCSVGGNIAGVDTFAGIRLDDPASGVANLGHLFEGTNLLCFTLQLVKTAAPTWAGNLFATLFELIGTTVSTVGCPEIPDLTRGGVPLLESFKRDYPGAARAGYGL